MNEAFFGLLCLISAVSTTVLSPCGPKIKVITDVADTLVGVGHLHRGGAVDNKWTHNLPFGHVFYPGIVQLHVELSKGLQGAASEVTILSPGTHLPANISESDIHEGGIAKTFLKAGSPSVPQLISGKVDPQKYPVPIERAHVFNAHKVQQHRRFQAEHEGEFSYILVGSNGQGDSAAARTLLGDSKSCVKAAFIHDVMPFSPVTTFGIHTYKTAADAAVKAYTQKLITEDGVRRVLDSIKQSEQWKQCQKPCTCQTCGKEVEQLVQGRPYWEDEFTTLVDKQACWCMHCQADKTGFAPACKELKTQVDLAVKFLVDINLDCDLRNAWNSCPQNMWCRAHCGDGLVGECVPFQREEEGCATEGVPECQQTRCNPSSRCVVMGDTLHKKTAEEVAKLVGTCYDVTREEVIDRNARALKYRKFITNQFTPGPTAPATPTPTTPTTPTQPTTPRPVVVATPSTTGLTTTQILRSDESSETLVVTPWGTLDVEVLLTRLFQHKEKRVFSTQQVFFADDDGDGDDDDNGDDDGDDGDDDGSDDNGDDDDNDGDDNNDDDGNNNGENVPTDDDGDPLNGTDDLFSSENGTLWLVIGGGILALCLAIIIGIVIYAAVSRHDRRVYGPIYYLRKARKPKIGEPDDGPNIQMDEISMAEAITNEITLTKMADADPSQLEYATHTTYPPAYDQADGEALATDLVDIELEERM